MTSWAPDIEVGPYELLGEGGMGEVWQARDKRLVRIVAVKRLKGEHGARFQQEARAIAALNHPHICKIYDIGPDYLVLEYVEGKPLIGPLGASERCRWHNRLQPHWRPRMRRVFCIETSNLPTFEKTSARPACLPTNSVRRDISDQG